jgi:hypothetical protein
MAFRIVGLGMENVAVRQKIVFNKQPAALNLALPLVGANKRFAVKRLYVLPALVIELTLAKIRSKMQIARDQLCELAQIHYQIVASPFDRVVD